MKDKKQSEFLKKNVRDLSDTISDMQDDLQTLDMYATGTPGMSVSYLSFAMHVTECVFSTPIFDLISRLVALIV